MISMVHSPHPFTKYPFFGRRQITAYLARDGVRVGRHQVPPRRLMRLMGFEAAYKLPWTTTPHLTHPVYP
jgi:putative transposase